MAAGSGVSSTVVDESVPVVVAKTNETSSTSDSSKNRARSCTRLKKRLCVECARLPLAVTEL